MGNTFEQYAGLKLSAASPFSEKRNSFSQKSQNRTFPPFEQYAGLESQLRWELAVQAAQGRGSEGPGSLQGSRGTQVPGMRKAVIWLFPLFPPSAAETVQSVG